MHAGGLAADAITQLKLEITPGAEFSAAAQGFNAPYIVRYI